MPLNPACAALAAPTKGRWTDVAAGISDEASTPNYLRMIPSPDPNLAGTSSPSRLSLTHSSAIVTTIAGQLAYIQEHQNIVRTTLCAPTTLFSTLTFISKMELSPLHSSPSSPSSSPLGELIKS